MLGDLIANLDRPDVTAAVLATLDPTVASRIERCSAAAGMEAAVSPPARFATWWIGRMTTSGPNWSQLCVRQKIQASPRSRRSSDGSLLAHSFRSFYGERRLRSRSHNQKE
jgi:hypothetical protein